MNHINNEDAIHRMMLAKVNLDALPLDSVDAEYIAIQTAISKYIRKHCKHNIVSDNIDLTLNTSAAIFYCEHCFECFTEP
jgi:hypothetical protein